MKIDVIAVPCSGATPNDAGRTSPLAQAADAYLKLGLLDDFRSFGAEIGTVTRPMIGGDQISGDPISNLGRYNALVAGAVLESLQSGGQPILAGGTCSHLIGMLSGLQQHFGAGARVGLVWLDAHGDFNTPRTSHSGMLGGMPVAVSAGLCHRAWRELAGMTGPIPTDRILLIDVRNLDPEEKTLIEATDATVAKFGPNENINEIVTAIQHLARHVDHLYLHVDADVLDASLQPNHPTAEPGGPGVESTVSTLRAAVATRKVRAFGVVSVNPSGPDGTTSLASGKALLVGGARAWSEFLPGV